MAHLTAWTNEDLAQLTCKAIEQLELFDVSEYTTYCARCSVVPTTVQEYFCVGCYADLYADAICDALAERYQESVAVEKGLY